MSIFTEDPSMPPLIIFSANSCPLKSYYYLSKIDITISLTYLYNLSEKPSLSEGCSKLFVSAAINPLYL